MSLARPEWTEYLRRLKLVIPGVGYPFHRSEDYEPFFIIGSGRSGTTLLRRILIASDQVHIPPETYVLGKVFARFSKLRNLDWETLVDLALSTLEYYPRFSTFDISLRPLADHLEEAPSERRSLAFLLDAFYRYHAASVGKSDNVVWGDKTPTNVFIMPQLLSVFPRARFIHLIRDPHDVVPSIMKLRERYTLEYAAKHWIESVQLAQRFARRHPGAICEIKYESLVTSPKDTARLVCDYLGIPFTEAMLKSEHLAGNMGDVNGFVQHSNISRPISAERIGAGIRELDGESVRQLDKLIGKDRAANGYPFSIQACV